MNMTLLLTVLSSCWRCFDAVFPYTSARLQHWLYFLSDASLNTLDHHSLVLTGLPLYLFLLGRALELDRGWRRPPNPNPPALEPVANALFKWFMLYQAIDVLSAFAVVMTTPGSLAKFLVALDLWFDLILTCAAKLSFCVLVQRLVHTTLYLLVVCGEPRNFTEYAHMCKAVLRLYFWGMVAAVVPGSRDDAFVGAHFREGEHRRRDREEELDNEGENEEDYGEDEYIVALAGVEGYYGEPGYDHEETDSEGFVEWEEGESDEDAAMPQREVHIGPLRYIVPWERERDLV